MSERDLRLLGHFCGLFSRPCREEVVETILKRLGQGNEYQGVKLPGKGGRTTFQKVSTMAMVAGNEEKLVDVIHNGHHKHWVGIGWVDMGPASDAHYDKYPVIADSADGGLAEILKLKPS